jgi:hypothetical protein
MTILRDREKPPNHKRVYRVMKVDDLLLDRHAGGGERRHDGSIAVDERNRRWCSDGFEIGCDNGERVRVAFALDCCVPGQSPADHHRVAVRPSPKRAGSREPSCTGLGRLLWRAPL